MDGPTIEEKATAFCQSCSFGHNKDYGEPCTSGFRVGHIGTNRCCNFKERELTTQSARSNLDHCKTCNNGVNKHVDSYCVGRFKVGHSSPPCARFEPILDTVIACQSCLNGKGKKHGDICSNGFKVGGSGLKVEECRFFDPVNRMKRKEIEPEEPEEGEEDEEDESDEPVKKEKSYTIGRIYIDDIGQSPFTVTSSWATNSTSTPVVPEAEKYCNKCGWKIGKEIPVRMRRRIVRSGDFVPATAMALLTGLLSFLLTISICRFIPTDNVQSAVIICGIFFTSPIWIIFAVFVRFMFAVKMIDTSNNKSNAKFVKELVTNLESREEEVERLVLRIAALSGHAKPGETLEEMVVRLNKRCVEEIPSNVKSIDAVNEKIELRVAWSRINDDKMSNLTLARKL